MAAIETCQVPRCTWPADELAATTVDVPGSGELELILCPLHAGLVVGVFDGIRTGLQALLNTRTEEEYWTAVRTDDGWIVTDDELEGVAIARVASKPEAKAVADAHNDLLECIGDAVDAIDHRPDGWRSEHTPLTASLPRSDIDEEGHHRIWCEECRRRIGEPVCDLRAAFSAAARHLKEQNDAGAGRALASAIGEAM